MKVDGLKDGLDNECPAYVDGPESKNLPSLLSPKSCAIISGLMDWFVVKSFPLLRICHESNMDVLISPLRKASVLPLRAAKLRSECLKSLMLG